MSKCILCRVNEAAVPDREQMGRPIKRVCRECHAARLRGDIDKILKNRERRAADDSAPTGDGAAQS